jgi:hypothetical protein
MTNSHNGVHVVEVALATVAHVFLALLVGYMLFQMVDMVMVRVTFVLILLIYLSNAFASLYLSTQEGV